MTWNNNISGNLVKCLYIASLFFLASCATGKVQQTEKDVFIQPVEKTEVKKKEVPLFIAKYNEGVEILQSGVLTDEKASKADELFKEAVTAKPDFWPAYYNRAHAAFFQKNYDDAEKYIVAAQKYHTNKEIELLAAAISSERGDKDKAIEMYSNVAALYGNVGFAYAQIGNIFMLKNDCKEALKHYKKSGKLTKQLYQVFINKGSCFLQQGSFAEAVKAFEAVYELGVKEQYLLGQYAHSLRKLGNVKKSVTVYEELIEKYPQEVTAYKNLGVIYELYLDKPAKAAKFYKKYIEIGGEDMKTVQNWYEIALDKSKR